MSRFYRVPVSALVVLVVVVASGQSQPTLPIRRTDGRASVALAQLQVTQPLNLYVGADGGATGCSQTAPCATLQRACDQVPLDICDAVTITASADYVGAGCRKEGIRFCSHPGTDGGVVWGSLTITGTRATYTPLDGGAGSGTISAVAAGSSCTRDDWSVTGGTFTPGELTDKWIGITSGTGSGTGKIWPIFTNDAGVIGVQSYGDATQPAASSAYQLYSAPGSTINATLGQLVVKGGPSQATNAGAFVLSSVPGTVSNGAGDDRRITIENFNVSGITCGGSTTSGFVIGNGQINLRHNMGTVCMRAATGGVTQAALERNIVTGGTNMYAGQFSSIGGNHELVQVYNNLATSAVSGTLSVERADALVTRGNYLPNLQYRIGACHNCVSTCDTIDSVRGGASGFADTNGAQGTGGMNFDGSTMTDASGTPYTMSLANGFAVLLGQNGGPACTITNASHAAALALGGTLIWDPTTVFTGAGANDVVFSSTSDAVTIATIHAMAVKAIQLWDGSRAFETGGTPNLDAAILATGRSAAQGLQHGAKTLSTGAGTVTLSPTFRNAPDCTCTDTTAVNAVKCPATTTTLTLTGTGSDVISWQCTGDY